MKIKYLIPFVLLLLLAAGCQKNDPCGSSTNNPNALSYNRQKARAFLIHDKNTGEDLIKKRYGGEKFLRQIEKGYYLASDFQDFGYIATWGNIGAQKGPEDYKSKLCTDCSYMDYLVIEYPNGDKPDTLACMVNGYANDPCLNYERFDYYLNGKYIQSGNGQIPYQKLHLLSSIAELDSDVLIIRK